MSELSDLFPFILIAAVASAIAAPLVRASSLRWRIMDLPGAAPHKRHSAATPLGGGLVIVAGIAVALIVMRPNIDARLLGMLGAGAWLLIWGMIDDSRGLGVLPKLLVQLVAAASLMGSGIRVHLFAAEWINTILSLLWTVGMINAFNFVDSMDGLALGLAGVAAGFFMLVTIESGQADLAMLSAVILGAAMGTFLHNSPPARVFLGDGGSQLLGIILAGIGVAYSPVGLNKAVSWFVPIAVLGVPIFDASLVVLSRMRRGRPVYQAGHDHTYHRLVGLGLHPGRAVLSMHIAAIALGLIGFMTLEASVLVANIIWGSLMLLGALAVLGLEVRMPGAPDSTG